MAPVVITAKRELIQTFIMEDPIKKSSAAEESGLTPGKAEPDLKSIRESKGMTLKDVFEQTRVSAVNLEAIEKGDFHLLPPPVFTKAFIKTYARTLGVESIEIIARYEEYLETLKETPKKLEAKNLSVMAGKHSKFILWGLSIFIAGGIIFFSISSYKSDVNVIKSQVAEPIQQAPQTKPADTTDMTSVAKGESANQVNPVPKPEKIDLQSKAPLQSYPSSQKPDEASTRQAENGRETIQQQPATGETYRLTIEAKELTWIRMTAGQNSPQEMLLRPGERVEQSAPSFVIHIGNAGGIAVDFQGESLGNLGRHGQVIHLKLP